MNKCKICYIKLDYISSWFFCMNPNFSFAEFIFDLFEVNRHKKEEERKWEENSPKMKLL